MLLKETVSGDYILFEPESSSERKKMEEFPGLLRQGTSFFSTRKQNVVSNLVQRLGLPIKASPQVKELCSDEIALSKLPEDFTFFTNPLPHQEIALRFLYTFSSAGLLLEPGLGKTKVILDFIHLKKFERACIICPKPLLFVWEEEVVKHRPELNLYVVRSTDWEKEKSHIAAAQVVVVNYDKCVSMEQGLTSMKFNFVGVDEGLIKNLHTARTKSVFEVSKHATSKVIMSGTLVNNSPIDIFSPVKFVEPSVLGVSITRFKTRFCVPAKFNKNVIIAFRHQDEVKSALQACCIVMTKAEWLKDLPPKTFHEISVTLPDEQRDFYQSLSANWIAKVPGTEEYLELDNPLPLLSKLTQVCNGFLYWGDVTEDENVPGLEVTKKKKGKRKVFEFAENPKITALLKLIGPNGDLQGRRAIIWFNMGHERVLIERALTEAGYGYLVVAGGEKNVGGKVNEFNKNDKIPFLICQAKTINYGVTVMGHTEEDGEEDLEDASGVSIYSTTVSDEIFFSLGFSLELFLQQQDRIHRIGQTKECHYWLLLTNTSVERKISTRLEQKLSCSRQLLQDIATSAEMV